MKEKYLEKIYFHLIRNQFKFFNSTRNLGPSFYIVSAGRSGSTLLRKLLLQSNQVIIPPESNSWIPDLLILFFKYQFFSWEKKIDLGINLLIKDYAFSFWEIDLVLLKKELLKLNPQCQNVAYFINTLYILNQKNKNLLVGDKTPWLSYKIHWLQVLNPSLKIVHLIRDPREVIYSRMKTFGESFNQALLRWTSTEVNIEERKKQLKFEIIDIKYDDMINQTDNVISRILAFLELECDQPLINTNSMEMADTILSHHEATLLPISNKYQRKWIGEFSEYQLEQIKKHTHFWSGWENEQ